MGTLIENINAISKIKSDLNQILRENGSDGGPVFMDYPDKFRELFRIVDDYADATEVGYEYKVYDSQTVVPDPIITPYQNVVTITCSLDKAVIRYWVESDSGNNDIGLTTLQKGSTIYLSENSTVWCYAQYREEKSNNVSQYVRVNNIEVPIPPVIVREDTTVTITSEQGYDIYYKIGAGGTYYLYTGPITVARSEDVYAYTRGYRANSDEVVDEAPEQPAKPLPPVISYSNNVITITCETVNITLYYREENGRWMPYTGPFAISKSGFYYAKSVNSYYMEAISNKRYCEYVAPAVPVTPEVPNISCSNNTVTITCTTVGSEIYYSNDGSTYSKYVQPIGIQQDTNFWAFSLFNGKTSSITGPYEAIYIDNPSIIPADPVIVCLNNVVTITCSTPGATIWYSTDNQNYLEYTQYIEIEQDTTFWSYSSLNGNSSSITGPYYADYDSVDYLSIPLTFSISENGTIGWRCFNETPSLYKTIEYRKNYSGEWTSITATYNGTTINVVSGDILEFRGNISPGYNGRHGFTSSCNFSVYGNIMSLKDDTNYSSLTTITSNYEFSQLFYNCSKLLDATKLQLPATNFINDGAAYHSMFRGCTSLVNPPELLPAIIIHDEYCFMFEGCTSLIKTPNILAEESKGGYNGTMECMFKGCTSLTTVYDLHLVRFTYSDDDPYWAGNKSFQSMFEGCTSLTTVPAIPILSITTLPANCCARMFYGCTSLTTIPSNYLQATIFGQYCFESMFEGCSSLTTLPELPSTVLGYNCYQSMFKDCTSLTTIPSNYLPSTTLKDGCYASMFSGCTSLTTAPTLPATILASGCYGFMFSGCTSLTTAPTLSATTLYYQCYREMFSGCTSLTTAPTLSATTLAEGCYNAMFSGCTSLTTAPDLPATTLTYHCYEEMFMGCTNLNYIKCLATDVSASYCITNWVNGVSENGTFVKAPLKIWMAATEYNNYSGRPANWIIEDAA